jgi:ppGpp synthetase/RelA/SpoT-type nucleotidyltranferase
MNTLPKNLKIPIEKQKEFIAEFKKIRPVYVEYAKLIDGILNKAVGSLSILAIVQARPKNVVSFSNKIISKDKYKNPLVDMTDLCGARVIVHFQSQVEKICTFIKENFVIDEANSLDAGSRLQVNEFGYRSIHYIVSPKNDSILGIAVEKEFKNLKAEIQVRTLAEHVWADISHDRIYKTELNIPDEWKREAARLSAMLENADREFAGMATEIDSLANVYELQFEKKKAEIDVEKLKTLIVVLQNDPDECIKNSLKLSAIYRAQDNFSEALQCLKPLLDTPAKSSVLHGKLRFEYGVVLALSCGSEINTSCYAEGIRIMDQTLKAFDILSPEVKKENEEVLSYLFFRAGRLLQRNEEETSRVVEYLTLAHYFMPENPLYLVSLMESIVLRNLDLAKSNITLFKSNISQAIPKLKELIEIGIKRVPAFFAIGHCCLLLDDKRGCINAYANAVETILNRKYLTSRATIMAEIALIGKLKALNPKLSEQVKLYLNIAMYLMTEEAEQEHYKTSLSPFRIKKVPDKTPVVIVAGGAAKMDRSKAGDYSNYIGELMHGFKGTIISGGTTSGIPGLVGEVKAEMEKNSPVDFDLEAYLPEKLPNDAVKSPAYDNFYETSSDNFSALDILVCWANLMMNGINPKDLILIGIDGGTIATMEYQIALSLGAKVALVAYSGRAVSEFLVDNFWKKHRNLLQLPNDPHTVWALVNQSAKTILSQEKIETLAPIAHEFYRQKRMEEFNPNTEDINKFKVLMPWDKLDASLQESNRKQVAFYEHILKRVNLNIREAGNPVLFNIKAELSTTEYDHLAKLEHARWNAERLFEGWRYGPEKNITAKLNPCITAWENLDFATRVFDYDPVDNIPKLLAKIGYEVYKMN